LDSFGWRSGLDSAKKSTGSTTNQSEWTQNQQGANGIFRLTSVEVPKRLFPELSPFLVRSGWGRFCFGEIVYFEFQLANRIMRDSLFLDLFHQFPFANFTLIIYFGL